MRTLREIDVYNKKVLVRCDFQVPLDEKGNVLDDFKIKAVAPTIDYLTEKKAKVILMSHWKPMESQKQAESLRIILPRLSEILKKEINFSRDCLGKQTEEEIAKTQFGKIILLENLRFYKEEEQNDDGFARQLAGLGDIYINDAFGVSHRPHASLIGIPKYLPSGAGFLLEKEINALSKIIENPKKPLVVIIGGAKVETKARIIDKISKTADYILISGLIQKEIKEKNIFFENPQKIIGPIDEIEGKDIGPRTIVFFKEKISLASTIFWNGPLGKTEEERFSYGTESVARFIADATGRAFSVVGGGETVEFVSKIGLIEKFNHVSTGGGAMIEFLSGEKLPGIEALEKNQEMFTA